MGIAGRIQEKRIVAFILDELLTISGDIQKSNQLWNTSQTRSYVMNIANVAPLFFMSIDQHSVFGIVTNDCHTNSISGCQVTIDGKRRIAFITIRVDDVRTASGL